MNIYLISVVAGLLLSYFLKDVQFLSLDLPFFNTGLIYPDFLLIYIAFFALTRGELAGTWVGFFAGLLEDGTNWVFDGSDGGFSTIIGVHSFVYSLLGYTLGFFRQYFQTYQTSFTILLLFVVSILSRFFIWILHAMIDSLNMNYPILGPALYTSVLSPVWFSFMSWLYRIQSK